MHGPRSDLLFGFQSRFLCSTLPVLLMMWCMRVRSSRLCLSTVLQRSSSICAGESSAQPSHAVARLGEQVTCRFLRFCLRCTKSLGGLLSTDDLIFLSWI